jgi:hypothetical protein
MAQGTFNRSVQHKPSRDIKQTPKERNLESEVKKLTRQLAQTRKRLVKAEEVSVSLPVEEQEAMAVPPKPNDECPKCHTVLV